MKNNNPEVIKNLGENHNEVRELKLVKDERPEYLKKLDKSPVEKQVKTLGDYELKRKSTYRANSYNFNTDAVKMYFSTFGEIVGRILIILGQFIITIVLFVFIVPLSRVVGQFIAGLVSNHGGGFVGPILSVASPIVIIFITIFSLIWIVLLFLILIPILICRTIHSIWLWSKITTILGTINGLIVIGLAFLVFLYVRESFFPLPGHNYAFQIVAVIGFAILVIGFGILNKVIKKYRHEVENNAANQVRYSKL